MAKTGNRLGKLSLAILENFVETKLGKRFVDELRAPTDRTIAIKTALEKSEVRFAEEFGDAAFVHSMFMRFKVSNHELMATAIGRYYDHPIDTAARSLLVQVFRKAFPEIDETVVTSAVDCYVRILTEELALADVKFRENISALADIRGERQRQEIVDVLHRVEETIFHAEGQKGEAAVASPKHQNRPDQVGLNVEPHDWVKRGEQRASFVDINKQGEQDYDLTASEIHALGKPYSATDLTKFKAACECLLGDIELAIYDHRYLSTGGKFIYAVDFSEIYAYALPLESRRDFVLFPDAFDDKSEIADATALQQLVLKHIFFDLPGAQKLILLSPYTLEYRQFVRRMRGKCLDDLVKRSVQVFDSLETILDRRLDTNIKAICEKIENQAEPLSKEEEAALAKFIKDYGYIASVVEADKGEMHPFHRIRQLSPDLIFERLDSIVELPTSMNATVYERWVSELRHKRLREGSAAVDAAAMNLVFEANRKLGDDTRLILITRSQNMHNLYQEELKKGLWADAGQCPLLRHPRMFSVALSVAQKGEDELVELTELKETIYVFLRTLDAWRPETTLINQSLLDEIAKIKQGWKRIQKTALPLGVAALGTSALPAISENARQARLILEFARDDKRIRQSIANDLDELFRGVEWAHETLGLDLQLSEFQSTNENAELLAVLSPRLSRPYELVFCTQVGKEAINPLFQKKELSVLDIVVSFQEILGSWKTEGEQEEEYDRALVMAYLLSLLGKWQLAEMYCTRGIKIGQKVGVATQEAQYFLAVCGRESRLLGLEQEFSATSLREVLELLHDAISDLRKTNPQAPIEARYWIEQGLSILHFHQSHEFKSQEVPAIEDGIAIIDEWEGKLNGNVALRLLAFEMELDLFANKPSSFRLEGLRSRYELLYDMLVQVEPDAASWPAYVVDVVHWGKWLLFPELFSGAEQEHELIEILENARKRENGGYRMREIARHIVSLRTGKSDNPERTVS